MEAVTEQLILRQDDYELMLAYLKGGLDRNSFDRQNAEVLEAELIKATLVDKDSFPDDVVRLNSKVKIRDEKEKKTLELTLVTPPKADIKQRKVSIMSPIGTALIGYRKGQIVQWKVPSGQKTFTILEVTA
jgi:regulator of nucleoside diphosphate kinase